MLKQLGANVGLIAGDKTSTFTAKIPKLNAAGQPFLGDDGKVAEMVNPDSGQVSHILLAGVVVLLIVVFARFLRGFLGQTSVLLAIVVGTVIAIPMGLVDFSAVGSSGWFGIAQPFHFGPPKFAAAAIISMCIVMLVTYVESTADMLAVGELTGRNLSPNDLARGLAVDGLSAFLAGFMNSFPDTAYAENVGLVSMTNIKSRWVVTVCGVGLVILGLIPKVGAIVETPAFYPYMTGYDNLRLLATYCGVKPSRVDATLAETEVIGLLFRGGHKHSVSRCAFLQAQPSFDRANRMASVVVEAGRSARPSNRRSPTTSFRPRRASLRPRTPVRSHAEAAWASWGRTCRGGQGPQSPPPQRASLVLGLAVAHALPRTSGYLCSGLGLLNLA